MSPLRYVFTFKIFRIKKLLTAMPLSSQVVSSLPHLEGWRWVAVSEVLCKHSWEFLRHSEPNYQAEGQGEAVIFLADTSEGPGLSFSRCSVGGNRQSPRSSPHRSAVGEWVREGRGMEREEGQVTLMWEFLDRGWKWAALEATMYCPL